VKPELRRFGNSESPVVVIDDFTGDAGRVAALADALSPFPEETDSYYPGVRRLIEEADEDAFAFVQETCRQAAQFIAGAFDLDSFALLRASFSMVSLKPNELKPFQRAPHFDSTDPNYLALLLYLRVPEASGTAFFRQRSSGIERVTDNNVALLMKTFEAERAAIPANSGYIRGSTASYEQIGAVEAVPDRLLIYQGSLLHSGIIPEDMLFSADPRVGRLTANLFVRGN
jgi:hypothetical protein